MSGKKTLPRNKPIRIVAADSNYMACGLLSEALNKQPGLSVVAPAVDFKSLRLSIDSLQPDIALVSASLPGGPLRSAHSPTRSGEPNEAIPCPWVLLLDESEPDMVVAGFRAGARGVFSRSQSDIGMLAKCVRRVVEGQIWVDTRQMLYLLEALTSNGKSETHSAGPPPRLTPREESVVRLVVQGMVNREIAEELRLSEHTVKNYLFRIFDKLGVSNRVELALYAVAKLKLEEESAA